MWSQFALLHLLQVIGYGDLFGLAESERPSRLVVVIGHAVVEVTNRNRLRPVLDADMFQTPRTSRAVQTVVARAAKEIDASVLTSDASERVRIFGDHLSHVGLPPRCALTTVGVMMSLIVVTIASIVAARIVLTVALVFWAGGRFPFRIRKDAVQLLLREFRNLALVHGRHLSY